MISGVKEIAIPLECAALWFNYVRINPMLLKALREVLGRLIVFINFLTRPRPMQRNEEDQARVAETILGI